MKKIICYGDSNTYGWDPRDFFGTPYDYPWPTILAQRLHAQTINLGEPGREIPVSRNELVWLYSELTRHAPADLLIIMLGTNDLLTMYQPIGERPVTRMKALLDTLQNWEFHIPILLLIPANPRIPMDSQNSIYLNACKTLAEGYQKLAATYPNVTCIDINQWGLPLAFDGVHLTEEAHITLGQKLAELIHP